MLLFFFPSVDQIKITVGRIFNICHFRALDFVLCVCMRMLRQQIKKAHAIYEEKKNGRKRRTIHLEEKQYMYGTDANKSHSRAHTTRYSISK